MHRMLILTRLLPWLTVWGTVMEGNSGYVNLLALLRPEKYVSAALAEIRKGARCGQKGGLTQRRQLSNREAHWWADPLHYLRATYY
jgi:hypothetical protein